MLVVHTTYGIEATVSRGSCLYPCILSEENCSCESVTRCTCCLLCFAACCAQLLVSWLLVGCCFASCELLTPRVVLQMVFVFSNTLHRTLAHGDAAQYEPPRTGRLKHDGALVVHLLPVMLCCMLCSTAC